VAAQKRHSVEKAIGAEGDPLGAIELLLIAEEAPEFPRAGVEPDDTVRRES